MKTLRKVFRLWRMYARLDALFLLRSPVFCATCILSDVVLGMASLTATFLLAERFEGVGIWSKRQILFLLGYALTVEGIVHVFFGYNVAWMSRRIGRGQLDHSLIQPQPLALGLLTEGFTPYSGGGMLILGIGVLAWATVRLSVTLSVGWFALVCLNLLASTAILLCFSTAWSCLAFWAPRGAEEIASPAMRMMYTLKPFPLDGLGGAALTTMLTAVPIGFVGWVPSRYLAGLEPNLMGGFVAPIAALVFVALTTTLFRFGLKVYERTGSQRYSGFGHRG